MLTALLAGVLNSSDIRATAPPPPGPRFERQTPLPGLPSVPIFAREAGRGEGNRLARSQGLQGRILWVDGTANLSRVSTVESIEALVDRAAQAGFNTIVFDVKPIVGRTLYPSDLTEQLVEWRDGQRLTPGFDPIPPMQEAARRHDISFILALNAFSEGHSFAKREQDNPDSPFGDPGWGYTRPDLQTVQYDPVPIMVVAGQERRVEFNPPQFRTGPAAFSQANLVPQGEDIRYVAIAVDGRVVAHQVGEVPALPANGSIIAAREEGGDWLASHARMGRRLEFSSRAQLRPIAENQTQIPLMMNPHLRENHERIWSFVDEMLERYSPDGIAFDDRLRFGGLNSDFSDIAREQLEAWVGEEVQWPEGVFQFVYGSNLQRGVRVGPHFDNWLTWRAHTMAEFMRETRARIDAKRPGTVFGIYAGSWYGSYAEFGNNYAAADLEAGFAFLNRSYAQTGFAESLDFLITGCYYAVPTIHRAMERGLPGGRTVEAAGVISNLVARDQTIVYAGIMIMDYWQDRRGFEQALQAATATTQGVMVFDVSHRIEEYWDIFDRGFSIPRRAPHQDPNFLRTLRQRRAALDQAGERRLPLPFFEGAPNTGF